MKMMIPHDKEGREAFIRRCRMTDRRFDFAAWMQYVAPGLYRRYPSKRIWDEVNVEKLSDKEIAERENSPDNPFRQGGSHAHAERSARGEKPSGSGTEGGGEHPSKQRGDGGDSSAEDEAPAEASGGPAWARSSGEGQQ